MRKSNFLAVFFLFISIVIYADEDYHIMEDLLLKRGYTRFDPKHESADYIYEDCYYKIFHKYFMFEKTGVRYIRGLEIGDGFQYTLYYVLERNDLPNLLTVTYIDEGEKRWGFYKKNIFLEGIILPKERTMLNENILAFY